MLLERALGTERFEKLAKDPVEFVRAFDREPWPYQAKIMREVTERDRNGRFTKRIAIVSTPRQNGKSTLSAWLALWRFFTDPLSPEIISVALDRESAGIILGDARRIISKSRVLYDQLDRWGLTKSTIRLKDGREWKIRSSDAVASRGLRPSTVCYDELGWSSDEGDLFQTLLAGQAAQVNPLFVITSTVGPIQAGPLWELFQKAEDPDSDVRLIYMTENLSPLITKEFLEGQKAQLPPSVFAREHENLWGSGSDAFCTADDYERAIDEEPRRSTGRAWMFIDLGWAHDESAIAISQKSDKTDIVHLEAHRPKGSGLSLDWLKGRIAELATDYGVREIEIESPQGVLMGEQLALEGLRVEILHPTQKSNMERWGSLYKALQDGTIRIPKDKLLRRQLLSLLIKSFVTGWRVVDIPSIHNDRAVAVAGATFMAAGGAVAHLPKGMVESLEQEGRFNMGKMSSGPPLEFKVRQGKSRWSGLG